MFQKYVQIAFFFFPGELNNTVETMVFKAEINWHIYHHTYLFYKLHLIIIFLLPRNKSALLSV